MDKLHISVGLIGILAVILLLSLAPCRAEQGPPIGGTPSASAERPLSIRVEQAAPFEMAADAAEPIWKAWIAPIISGLTAVGGAFVGGLLSRGTNAATMNQKANELEQKAIQVRLDGFHGPYLQRSEENRLLVEELRRRQPKGFRTLLSLLDPAWLKAQSKSDQTIVDTIVENGLVLQGLIREQSGAVDPALLPFLAKAGTHFTMLRLAREGALDNDRERFAPYVYPRELDEILRLETTRLRSRLEQLSDRPTARHPPLGPLIIPDALLTTMLGASPETIPPAADASHRAPIG